MTALGPGLRVRCISPDWLDSQGAKTCGPALGAVLTVAEVMHAFGIIFLIFPPWPNDKYDSKGFVPLDGNEDISELEAALNKGPVEGDQEREVVEIAALMVQYGAEFAR
jgi:hypothetical protein